MGHAFLNSLFITIPSTLIPLAVGSLAAFAFAWIRFPLRDTIFLTLVALMVVPIQTSLVPLLKLFRTMGVTDSYVGIWLAHTAFGLPLAIFLLRNFFITLPRDLIEAARIDGASNLSVFRRIVVPLSVPAIASYGDLPVPLGLERPADGADLRPEPEPAADDAEDQRPALDVRAGVEPPQLQALSCS